MIVGGLISLLTRTDIENPFVTFPWNNFDFASLISLFLDSNKKEMVKEYVMSLIFFKSVKTIELLILDIQSN